MSFCAQSVSDTCAYICIACADACTMIIRKFTSEHQVVCALWPTHPQLPGAIPLLACPQKALFVCWRCAQKIVGLTHFVLKVPCTVAPCCRLLCLWTWPSLARLWRAYITTATYLRLTGYANTAKKFQVPFKSTLAAHTYIFYSYEPYDIWYSEQILIGAKR